MAPAYAGAAGKRQPTQRSSLEDLVVRGDDPRRPRARARAGRSGCAARARRSAPRRSRRRARGARSSRGGETLTACRRIASTRSAICSSSARVPVRPRPRSSTIALPSPETPSSSLTTDLPDAAAGRRAGARSRRSRRRGCGRARSRAGARRRRARTARARRSWSRGGRARGRRPWTGMPSSLPSANSSSVVTYGMRWAASWSGISQRMRVSSVGRSSSLADSGRREGSSALSIVSRSRASSRMSAGSRPR